MRTLTARVAKSESKGTKSEPEATKSEPKGNQKTTQKRPKYMKKSIFGKCREKGSQKRRQASIFGPLFGLQIIKNPPTHRRVKAFIGGGLPPPYPPALEYPPFRVCVCVCVCVSVCVCVCVRCVYIVMVNYSTMVPRLCFFY